MRRLFIAALAASAPLVAHAQSVNAIFNDAAGNALAEILGGQSSAIARSWPCLQGNPATFSQIYTCGSGTLLTLSGKPSSGGAVQLGLPGDYVGVGTASPAGTLDVEGGTAAAGANGAGISLVAQNAGNGATTVGGNINLTPGKPGQGGASYVGSVNLNGTTYVTNGAGATTLKVLTDVTGSSGAGLVVQGGGGSITQVYGFGSATNVTLSGKGSASGTVTIGKSGDTTTLAGPVTLSGALTGQSAYTLVGNSNNELDIENAAGGMIVKAITSSTGSGASSYPTLQAGGGVVSAIFGGGNSTTLTLSGKGSGGGILNLGLAGDIVVIPTATPSSAAATGTTGQIAWDASFVYICTATNTWKRVAIATW